jgi:hypothetical protein
MSTASWGEQIAKSYLNYYLFDKKYSHFFLQAMDLTILSMVTNMMWLMSPAQRAILLQLLHVSMVLIVPILDVVARQPQQVVSLWIFLQHVRPYVVRVPAILQLKIIILAIHALVY